MVRIILLLLLITAEETFSAITFGGHTFQSPEPWNLPAWPLNLPDYKTNFQNNTKRIPRLLWIGYKKAPKNESEVSYHLKKMMAKNANWKPHLVGAEEQHKFMDDHFANTSLLWAFKSVNPIVGVPHSDIWRYAALYVYGGFYIDDDSYIDKPFDEIITPEDSIIFTRERHPYRDVCYKAHYHLSGAYMTKKFNSSAYGVLFEGRVLVQWGIFSEPRHPILKRALENIIEIFKHEYIRKSVFAIKPWDARWMQILCSTGPSFLTASTRELIMESTVTSYPGKDNSTTVMPLLSKDQMPRITKKIAFVEYGGIVKIKEKSNEEHYMTRIEKYKLNVIEKFMEDFTIEALEGRYVTYDPRNLTKSSPPVNTSTEAQPLYYYISGGKKHKVQHVCAYLFATQFAPPEAPPAITIKTSKLLDTIPAAEDILPCKVPYMPPEPSRSISAAVSARSIISDSNSSSSNSNSSNSSSIGNDTASGSSSATTTSTGVVVGNAFKGLLVTSDRRSFTLIRNCDCARWSFPDYDTFLNMGFKGQQAVVMELEDLNLIPIGSTLPSLQTRRRRVS